MAYTSAIQKMLQAESRTAMKRVLVYSHDTFGLGNIRRMLEISKHLVETDPNMSVLIITGSPMLHAFRIPPRIDYVKLPCLSRTATGGYEAKYLDLSTDDSIRLRANLIRSTIVDFQPDLILVDKKPFGVKDELAGALAILSGLVKRPKLVLLLRDILDRPDATTPVWRKNGYFEAIDAYYDDVLVVGTPEVFDLRAEYAFPPLAAAKVTYCGYIARTLGCQSCSAVRRELGVGCDERLVLVTPGGGEDGVSLLHAYLGALAQLPRNGRPHSLIVCGPEMNPEQHAEIQHAAAALTKVTVRSFTDDMMSLMSAADLVVCMGGYNTVCEVLTLQKRAIVVPRIKPVEEQWIRAERMAQLGLLTAIHPDRLSAESLAAALTGELAALGDKRPAFRLLEMDGLDNVAAAIQAHMRGPAAPESEPIELDGDLPWHPLPAMSASW